MDEKKKAAEVSSQLRTVDRSYERWDLHQMTLKTLRNAASIHHTCACCTASEDYPLLAMLREKEETQTSAESKKHGEDSDKDDDDDDDDDDFDDDLDSDEFLTQYEIERRQKMEEAKLKFDSAENIGFTAHVEESWDHLLKDVAHGMPIVLHIYSANSEICARLALAMENLAKKFIGTKFRRIAYPADVPLEKLEFQVGVSLTEELLMNGIGFLMCFTDGKVQRITDDYSQFGEDSRIYTSDLINYLENTHVLYEYIQPYILDAILNGKEDRKLKKDEDIDKTRYCDDPDCTRYFPHEHIGGKTSAAPSFAGSKQLGDEALADNIFTRI